MDPRILSQLNIDPILTELVLGQPFETTFPGDRILKDIRSESWKGQYRRYGTKHLRRHQTERGLRAPIKSATWDYSMENYKLRRFSLKAERDLDEYLAAHESLDLRVMDSALARQLVRLDVECIKRDLLVDSSNYGGTLAIANGSEWNQAGGDSRGNIHAACDAITAATGGAIQRKQCIVALLGQSLQAALDDPILLSTRSNYTSDTPDEDVLARYWGVGSVWSANPTEVDDAGVISSMYGNIAIVYYDGGAQVVPMNTEYGNIIFGVNFRWNKGTVLSPWVDQNTTTIYFPWQQYDSPQIINPSAGFLITNTFEPPA